MFYRPGRSPQLAGPQLPRYEDDDGNLKDKPVRGWSGRRICLLTLCMGLAIGLFSVKLYLSIFATHDTNKNDHVRATTTSELLFRMGSDRVCRELVQGEQIGKGSMKNVFSGVVRGTNVAVAEYSGKQKSLIGTSKISAAKHDWRQMSRFRSKYVVKAYGLCLPTPEHPHPRVVQEWMPFGDLRKLKTISGPLSNDWDFHLGIAEQLAAAMATIHEARFSMEDLVPGQFLVTGIPNYQIKVVDIDSLRKVPPSGNFRCHCWGGVEHEEDPEEGGLLAPARRQKGKEKEVHHCAYERTSKRNKHCLAWRSPEQIRCNRMCTLKSDVFSLAMVLWAIMPGTGKPYGEWPYGDPKDGVTRDDVIRLAGKHKPPVPHDTPEGYRQLLYRCWDNNPDVRPSMSQLAHKIAKLRANRHEVDVIMGTAY